MAEENTAKPTPGQGGSGIYTLLEAAHLLEERIEHALEEVGLSSAKYGVISVLLEAGEPLSLGEIAGRVHCVRSNMTQMVDRLEADGLVQRTNDPNDRRVIRAELTPLGKERATAGMQKLNAVHAEFSASLSEADRASLDRVLSMLR